MQHQQQQQQQPPPYQMQGINSGQFNNPTPVTSYGTDTPYSDHHEQHLYQRDNQQP